MRYKCKPFSLLEDVKVCVLRLFYSVVAIIVALHHSVYICSCEKTERRMK
jgi:hypothetical protein